MGCHIYHGPYVYNFQEIYDYLDKEKFSEKINTPEVLAEKLTKNFSRNFEESAKDIGNLDAYSSEIFRKVINEYKNFVK